MTALTTKRIDQLGRVITGKTPSSERPEEFGDAHPFLTPSDIPATRKLVQAERYLSERGMEEHRRIQLPKKSTCVVCIGATIGKVCMAERPSISNQQINSIIPFQGESDPDFIYYLSTTLRDSLVAFAGGAATPIINKSTFSSLKLLVPEFNVQEKIGAILSAYDELIENNQRRIALLEKLAEEIYREWFVRLRFPGHEKVRVVKRVPQGWREAKLGDLLPEKSLQTGKRPKGGAQEIGVPSIGAENVVGLAQHDFLKEKYVSEQFFDSMRQGHVADRDILFYKDGAEIGRVTLLQDGFPHEKCAVNEHVFLIRTHNLSAQYFLFFYLSQPRIQEHVKTINKNAAQPGINRAELRSIPIVLPPSELIEEFEQVICPSIRQIFNLAKAQRVLARTRNLLLPRLISGKLSVENLDIQFPPGMVDESNSKHSEIAHA